MPIDPFLALNAMIRAEVTRSADPEAAPAAPREAAVREAAPGRGAAPVDGGRSNVRNDDVG
ncbi:hypothetical protein ACIQM4_23460 [Streptomyces sp. NPDC091272]|uniref:hypothetical protein n=1 Tax=Streptomyces sp. NPDC091272 TaxID=3365981 RepID=UPI0038299B88